MKTAIIGFVLSFMMFAFPVFGQEQNSSRQSLIAFYNDYLMTANRAFNHPTQESTNRLKEFYSPKLIVHQFFPLSLGMLNSLNREEWLDLLFQVHSKVKETLHTNQLVIDPDSKQIAAQQTITFTDYENGETIVSINDIVIYSLEEVEGHLKIASLQLMFSDHEALPTPFSE